MSAPEGPAFAKVTPEGDTVVRDVCTRCGFVAYENPKIVVGAVVRVEDRVLLCRRAIEPRAGFWTVPAGYLELNESPQDGARREAREEANAAIRLGPLLAVYTVARLSQVQLIYRATLPDGAFSAGHETLEAALVPFSDVPWDALAFPTVRLMLRHDMEAEAGARAGRALAPFAATV